MNPAKQKTDIVALHGNFSIRGLKMVLFQTGLWTVCQRVG